MSAEAPQRSFCLVVHVEIVRPNRLAVLRIQTKQISFSSQRVDFSIGDGGSAARTGGVRNVVFAIVSMGPQRLARLGIEAEHSLLALHFVAGVKVETALATRQRVVHHKDLSRGDGRSGISA